MSWSSPHFVAVKSMIQRDPVLDVSDAMKRTVEGAPFRGSYVILWPAGPETVDDGRLSKNQDMASDAEYVYDGQAVAVDPLGVLYVIDRVVAQVMGQRPEVAGRRCDPIRVSVDPVDSDSKILPPLFYARFELSFWSRRP